MMVAYHLGGRLGHGISRRWSVGNGTVREVDGISGFLLHFRVFWRERFIRPAKQGEMGLWIRSRVEDT